MSELEELRKRAQGLKERQNARLKELYQYARSLGFSSEEARLLSFTSRAKIQRIAKEKEGES